MPREKRPPLTITPRAKVWLEIEGDYVFGLGICRILDAVEETGSIKGAAAAVGKSYRHVWSRIKEVEQKLGIPLVATQVGGGDTRRSALTEPARQLASSYRQMRQQVFAVVEEKFSSEIQRIVTQAGGEAFRR